MNNEDIQQLTQALKAVVEVENKKLEKRLEDKIGNLEKHNKHHELLDKYDEIFNDATLDILRKMATKAIEREERKEKVRDYITKTVLGSLTLTLLGVFYAIGKFVLANIEKIF